ncbi:hypothetical protein [Mycobacterium ostraviense]|uniref:hypothetical protein n=1 Tax=Mycobacterium ostraviense TaxID=2738409 RepID=UPI0015D5088E|nr:hypothetical protein [Mycobacterium ostraviense]
MPEKRMKYDREFREGAVRLLTTRRTIKSLLAWSHWRRRHQYRAQLSHYQRQENQ